jgi:group I intron endonuclease
MSIGIYCIENLITSQKYIGKSSKIENRFLAHRYTLMQKVRSKDCNRHLYNSAQKYGIDNFSFYILEMFDTINENLLKDRELYWMDFHKTCMREFGFNLRRDSSTNTIMSQETKDLQSKKIGPINPNYGNRWTQEQKLKMSIIAVDRHETGVYYGESWKQKIGAGVKEHWKDLEKRASMAKAVSIAKEKYDFYQYMPGNKLIRVWSSVKEIVKENPTYKWQNIYAVCNGYKPTYMGFTWEKKLKNIT